MSDKNPREAPDPAEEHEAITPDIAVVREHLIVHLGAPYEVSQLQGNPLDGSPLELVEIAYFAPGGVQAPVLFATCGVSQTMMPDGQRVEGVFMVRPAPRAQEALQAIYNLLGAFALYPDQADKALGVGDVIPGGPELSAVCQMDGILILPPVQFVEGFQQVKRWDQQVVNLLWLVPVFEAEAEYALQNGPEALLMLFAAQGLDLTDLSRDEANTVMTPEDAEEMAKQREIEDAKKPRATPQMAAPQPMPKRRQEPTTESFQAEDAEDGGFVVRRKKKSGLTGAEPTPSRPAPSKKSKAKPKGPKRFDIGAKDRPKKKRPPVAPARKTPVKAMSAEEQAAAKQERIDELKADAKARAARAKKRKSEEE